MDHGCTWKFTDAKARIMAEGSAGVVVTTAAAAAVGVVKQK